MVGFLIQIESLGDPHNSFLPGLPPPHNAFFRFGQRKVPGSRITCLPQPGIRPGRLGQVSGQFPHIALLIAGDHLHQSMCPRPRHNQIRVRYPVQNHVDVPGVFCPNFNVPDPPQDSSPLPVFLPHTVNKFFKLLLGHFHVRRSLLPGISQRQVRILLPEPLPQLPSAKLLLVPLVHLLHLLRGGLRLAFPLLPRRAISAGVVLLNLHRIFVAVGFAFICHMPVPSLISLSSLERLVNSAFLLDFPGWIWYDNSA